MPDSRPTKLSEEHRWKLQLHSEREKRLEAEDKAMRLSQVAFGRELAGHKRAYEALAVELREAYGMEHGDDINVETGGITRSRVRAIAAPAPLREELAVEAAPKAK